MHASKDSMWRGILKIFAKWSVTKQHLSSVAALSSPARLVSCRHYGVSTSFPPPVLLSSSSVQLTNIKMTNIKIQAFKHANSNLSDIVHHGVQSTNKKHRNASILSFIVVTTNSLTISTHCTAWSTKLVVEHRICSAGNWAFITITYAFISCSRGVLMS